MKKKTNSRGKNETTREANKGAGIPDSEQNSIGCTMTIQVVSCRLLLCMYMNAHVFLFSITIADWPILIAQSSLILQF